MYLIDKSKNRIQKIQQKTFGELGFKERGHLQEWLENNPEALGEPLLIIQKEFSGFNETNERLDLLALDKQGNLVVIENKLDDTGRDVTWQVIKYASYCSTLTKDQVRQIYQQYLDKQGRKQEATNKISEFFNQTEYDEVPLNQRQTQRIIMVAGSFRKEVTSTVLWLINYKLKIKCFKGSPFALDNQLFLTLDQIIPTKDTVDYVISMADKTQEDISTQDELKSRHHIRMEFWKQLLPKLQGKTPVFQNTNPTKDHWLSAGAGISASSYNFSITKSYANVSISFGRESKEENKQLFDEIKKMKKEIENDFGNSLEWERLDDKISSRIGYTKEGVNLFEKADWGKMLEFLSTNMIKLEKVFREPLKKVKKNFKTAEQSADN